MAPCCSRCLSRSERAGEQRASTGRRAPGRPLCGPRRCAKRPCPSASCRGPCSQTRCVRAVKRVWAHSIRAEHVLASRETRLRGAPRSRAPLWAHGPRVLWQGRRSGRPSSAPVHTGAVALVRQGSVAHAQSRGAWRGRDLGPVRARACLWLSPRPARPLASRFSCTWLGLSRGRCSL